LAQKLLKEKTEVDKLNNECLNKNEMIDSLNNQLVILNRVHDTFLNELWDVIGNKTRNDNLQNVHFSNLPETSPQQAEIKRWIFSSKKAQTKKGSFTYDAHDLGGRGV